MDYKTDLKYKFLEEKRLLEDEYDSVISKIEESNNVHEIIEDITRDYHNTTRKKNLVRSLLKDNLKADFFQKADPPKTEPDINAQIIFKKDDYSVEFSNSGYKTITIRLHAKDGLIKPEDRMYGISKLISDNKLRQIHSLYKSYKNKEMTRKELVNKHAELNGKANSPLFKIKSFIIGIGDEVEYAEEILEYESNIKGHVEREMNRFYESKNAFFELMRDLKVDLETFKNLGWKIEYARIDKRIYKECEDELAL